MMAGVPTLDAVTMIICCAVALGSGLYVCFGRVVIRAIISLFLCLFGVSWALVALGHEFLGFLSLFVAVAAAGAFLLYSSSIIGNIQEERLESVAPARLFVARVFGLFVGIGGGVLAASLLLGGGTFSESAPAGAGASEGIGAVMMGDHAVSFILVSSACLGLMMGVGILVRGARR
jgi:NADH:ubiquinone oxidoreductase subunit 6 (subunit J)